MQLPVKNRRRPILSLFITISGVINKNTDPSIEFLFVHSRDTILVFRINFRGLEGAVEVIFLLLRASIKFRINLLVFKIENLQINHVFVTFIC